jgi:dTDP-4-dehydrorhamnose reductase
MNIAVLGAHGMAGHVISKYLKSKGHSVVDVARTDTRITADFEDRCSVDQMLDQLRLEHVDYVINCVGLLVKDSIDRPDRAACLNSWLPHYLEHRLSNTATKLVHLSTDCVFDGSKGNYTETDTHTEKNSYGRSKSLGEVNNHKDITFRMSIIGPELKASGTGLFNWFLNRSDLEVNGWENAWWNGITTLQLAKCIDLYMHNPTISGVYHLVNNNVKINKYELLCKINEIYSVNKTVIRTTGPKPVDKILVDTRQQFNFAIPDYHVQLTELRDF